MANVLIESQTMTDIADAIREKNGTDTTYKPAEMPQAVRDIKSEDTGIGSRQWWLDVFKEKTNFSDMFEGCTSLTTIPPIDTSKGKYFSNMFQGCTSLTTIPQLDISNGTNFASMFFGCANLEYISLNNALKASNFSYTFHNCISMTKAEVDVSNAGRIDAIFNICKSLKTISKLNPVKCTNFGSAFGNCFALENITFTPLSIQKNIAFTDSPLLSSESIQSIIDGLADLTGQTAQTITFHSTVKNKLTEEQIASVTSKNWNIA